MGALGSGGIEQKRKKLMDMENSVVIIGEEGMGESGREYEGDKW